MLKISDKSKCCGCGACGQICARGAISMRKDELGFAYPEINSEKCNDCGLCEKICSFGKAPEALPEGGQQYLAARHKDNDTLMESRSGGAFTALSDAVLKEGGVVYGAEFAEDFSVRHSRATGADQRNRFRGSKYIQSDMGACLREVKQDLKQGKKVLFSGTSCQCDALKHFLPSTDNLILADVLCHGVASPAVWQAYIKKDKREIKAVDFRDKKHFGWKEHKETIYYKDGSSKSSKSFTDLYYKHIMHRPCCAECPYNSLDRVTDITMADFWGWEKTDREMNADDKGYSLLIINSDKGRELFNAASSDMEWRNVDIASCMQRPLKSRIEINPRCTEFENAFLEKGINYVLRKYSDRNIRSQMRYLYKKTRKLARKILLNK